MRVRLFPVIVVCFLCAFSAAAQTVIENETQIVLGESTSTLILNVNSPENIAAANIRVSFLSPSDEIKDTSAMTVSLIKGKNRIEIPVSLADIVREEDFAFYRFKYEIGNVTGFASLSQIVGDIFDIEAFAFDLLQKGSIYRVRSRAIQMAKLNGVANVQMAGVLDVEYEDGTADKFVSKNTTDADGFADFDFVLTSTKRIEGIELKLTGTKNGFSRRLSRSVPEYNLRHYSYLYFQTDKPLYQPEQTLKVRTLFFDDNKKALTGTPLVFTIKDPDGTILQRIETVTSRFGIASFEWQVPENAKLGEYTVTVKSTRQLFRDEHQFKVSRYDLPNFSVNADADRKFYLPENKTASVKVSADYLFGRSVTNAKVRVVRETDRQWDSKLGRYVSKEGAFREGMLDSEGKFTADFDLTKEHKDFEDSTYEKFEDINFAAYVTDLTTNKTEQKRFDIRITKKRIHIYISGENGGLSKRLPGRFYVTTFYPDGEPAACDLKIYQAHEDSEDDDPKTAKLLATAKTNRTGAARVLIPFDVLKDNDDDLDLIIQAKDSSGNRSFITNDFDIDQKKPAVQVSTDKIIYRQGEPLHVSIISSEPDAVLFIDVMQGPQTFVNEKVRLRNGKATLDIPFAANFKGSVSVIAYASYRDDYDSAKIFSGYKTVAYPLPHGLLLKADAERSIFRPGEEATINFTSARSDGKTEETAFGIAVLDKAIVERARTDAAFGGRYQSFYSDFEDMLGSGRGFAGLSGQDVDNMDTSQPLSPEAELALEINLNNYVPQPYLKDSGNLKRELESSYRPLLRSQFSDVSISLRKHFNDQSLAAIDKESLKNILALDGIDIDSMLDPWGNPYRTSVNISNDDSLIVIKSDGADEMQDTADDIEAFRESFRYFSATGEKIDQAFFDYHKRTGEFILNYKQLRDELMRKNFDLDALRDAWGKRYRFDFGIDGSSFSLNIVSGGWNRKFGKYGNFTIWTNRIDYFEVLRRNMAAAFRNVVQQTQSFPREEAEFKSIMRSQGFDLDKMLDVYGHPYYVVKEQSSRYADKTNIDWKINVTAISQNIVTYVIKSSGFDGIKQNNNDFELTRFIGIVSETGKDGNEKKNVKVVPASKNSLGAISGRVMDANGAVVPGVKIVAERFLTKLKKETVTDDEGYFILADLAPGRYELSFDSNGFRRTVVQNVTVTPKNLTQLDVTLDVGAVNETVNVTAGAETVNTTNASISSTVTSLQLLDLPLNGRRVSGLLSLSAGVVNGAKFKVVTRSGVSEKQAGTEQQIETPRLREYFPETLAWFPELISGIDGTAKIKFKLADSLTTWKIDVIGSTVDGDIGIVEKEITAFQPFFVDLDPPKFLTDGDEVSLPVQVRNYTEKPQKVDVSMAKSDWFSFLNNEKQQVEVNAGSSQNAVFGFRTIKPVKNGKQNVTAIADADADAIEKPVTVRPNGQEIVKTDSKIFAGTTKFNVDFPANALPKTHKAELKIYPNLFSHVAESVEGLLQRPYGCGEQTISSTYPNLMVLKFKKTDSVLRTKAQKYLQKGYERLLGYQGADGGFTYWGPKETSNVALTAYALRFLKDAKAFVSVDDDVIRNAENYLIKEQNADGSWTKKYLWGGAEDVNHSRLTTAYIARSLAMLKLQPSSPDANANTASQITLQKALDYLKLKNAEIDEPYALALYGLALIDSGDLANSDRIAERLVKLAIKEGDANYWNLETNTPFYGWGTAGRIETTALVLQFLVRNAKTNEGADSARKVLVSKATSFLLKNKDRYGVWYSTQATINVLDAFVTSINDSENHETQNLEVFLNGESISKLDVTPDMIAPFTLDITSHIDAAVNSVEIKASDDSTIMTQAVSAYYIDWKEADVTHFNVNQSRAIRLDYKCDKMNAAILQDVICSVEAERLGFQGYGMLLAEIGIPPGADINRESLQKEIESDWSVSRYEILPDRIIVYMWAKAGGTKFDFKFRPRYGINAQTPASTVYDYYNPEAHATVAPLRFIVK